MIVQSQDYVRNVDLDYHEGERYPVLQRAEGTPDLLDEITKPLSSKTVIPEESLPSKAPASATQPPS